MSELRDILDLPDQIRKSEFVVRINEAVSHPEEMLRSYAVTGDIANAYDTALGYVKSAIEHRKSEASYIHGSFGSGKSHFMSVLSLMLQGDLRPWNIPELHEVKARHDWLADSRVLCVQLNMVGAAGVEDKLFPAYLEAVRARHPEAPVPAFFHDQELFASAQAIREELGDEAFFAALERGRERDDDDGGWGEVAAAGGWDPAGFDAARASADPDERARLFSDLVQTPMFAAYAQAGSRFKDIDEGLSVLSRHARELGYQAVVLLLDELVLWLASRAGDRRMIGAEVQKVAKLIDHERPRPAPVVSFIARQRDLVELVGEQYAGNDAQNLRDLLSWWEGRINTITLQDTNLPTIVEKRVVRPKPGAEGRVDEAFGRMKRGLGPAWQTLLGDIGDERAFRQVYPFSPALVEALVALATCLQRERTSLKLLMELLVEHLDDFEMGKVVPVGDLFDALAGGEEPMDGAMKERFRQAKQLYRDELLPRIQDRHGTATAERCQRLRDAHRIALGCSNCAEKQCRTDNRLIKTLLLAALVPQVKVLKDLSARRLVELNHGTLNSPVPGREANLAATRLRHYAGEVDRLRVGDDSNPAVKIVLEGVDIRPLLADHRGYDSPGARRRKVQEVLYAALGVDAPTGTTSNHRVVWRGSRRTGTIVFGNVRELENIQLACGPDEDYKVVIDYPFDDEGHTPQEDESRLHRFRENSSSWTLVWLPSFFGPRVIKDLGELVILDRILEDPRTHLQHLRVEDQQRALDQLEHLQSQKRQRVRTALEAAYGLVSQVEDGVLDHGCRVEKHAHLLAGGEIRSFSQSVMDKALEHGVHQLLDQRYPRHPRFAPEAKAVSLKRLEGAYQRWRELCDAEDKRIEVARAERPEVELLGHLGMAEVSESRAVLDRSWAQNIRQSLDQQGMSVPTVAQLRRLRDPDDLRGLVREVAEFEIAAFAAADARELVLAGRAVSPRLGKLPDEAELVQTALPSEQAWRDAVERGGGLFGISSRKSNNPGNLRGFVAALERARDQALDDGADRIDAALEQRRAFAGADAEQSPRARTARAVADLLAGLQTRDPVELVQALAGAEIATSIPAMRAHLVHAGKTLKALDNDIHFNALAQVHSRGGAEATALLAEVSRVLASDEINVALADELHRLVLRAQVLGEPPPAPARVVRVDGGDGAVGTEVGAGVVGSGTWEGNDLAALARQPDFEDAVARAGDDFQVQIRWTVRKKGS